jgi:heavy metal sensor kinase
VKLPIRLRITIWYVALLAVLVGALGIFVVTRLRTDLVDGIDASLDTRASQIALGFQESGEGDFQDISDTSLRGLPGGESAAQLLDPSGAVLQATGDPAAEQPLIDAADLAFVADGGTVRRSIQLGPDAESFRILAIALPGASSRVVVVATSLDTVASSVGRLTILLLLGGPAVLVIAGIGGWWLARAALAPVSRIARTAGEIGIEQLDERVDVPGTADEVHDLAVTINRMLERLERGVKDQRRFIDDASHELRTPLAVMRAELEVALRERGLDPGARATLESLHQDAEGMGATVEDLLTLARADEGKLALAKEAIDLRSSADAVRAALEPMAAASNVEVRLEGEGTPVIADERRIEQVLRNLLANAITYAGPGGHVVVKTWKGDGSAYCSVRDDGPGIPDRMRSRVFDRFFRADEARTGNGAGLGLAICRELVTAHGGRIQVDSQQGSGSTFTFTIPSS